MNLKNTYKSKIIEKKIPSDLFYAYINNNTSQTDTISKNIHTRFVQFYFCSEGKVNFHFGENYSRVLEQGNSFMIYQPKRDMPIQISMMAKSKLHIIVISVMELHHLFSNEIFQSFFQDSQTQVYEEQPIPLDIRNVFLQLEQVNISSNLHDLYWKNKLSEVVLLYFSFQSEEETCPYLENETLAHQVRKAKELIIKNIAQPKKIAYYAQEVDLSEYQLKEGFKKIYGKTISQYILQYRMQKGKEEIEKQNQKVMQIAKNLGYENPSHFIDAFKREYGITPKQYEKSLQ